VRLSNLESINASKGGGKGGGKGDDWKYPGKPAPKQEGYSQDLNDEIPF